MDGEVLKRGHWRWMCVWGGGGGKGGMMAG
jgi:hypothetical protein